jgi:glucose-6-phosphate 1-epimerase
VSNGSVLDAAVLLEHPSGSTARITRHGAQVVSWTDQEGRERLYLSRDTRSGPDASIRGGIPVVFPQFGTGPLPKHGFVRTREWSLVSHLPTSATLRITDDDVSRALWPHHWMVELHVELGDALSVRMHVRNTGDAPFDFTAALHNYFLVDDIARAQVHGLGGVSYVDKTVSPVTGSTATATSDIQRDDALTIVGETDRVYERGPRSVSIEDAIGTSATHIAAEGFGDWVVWNPWRAMAAGLGDMPPDDYRRMLCVEAARVSSPIALAPDAEWTGMEAMTVT